MTDAAAPSIEVALAASTPAVRHILEAALCGRSLAIDDAVALCSAEGHDLQALRLVADALRAQQVGDAVSYVVNRNINFTNVCTMSCRFCAFSRTRRSEEGYYLDTEQILRRASQAVAMGATEVCVQAGLPPDASPTLYTDLLRALRSAFPKLHLHAMSPEEVRYGAKLRGFSIEDFLIELKEAGLNSLPGTSAEILDDGVRKRLAGGRISSAQWVEVVTTAHRLGLPTTATVMYGHIESDRERMAHLCLLRSLQHETEGFTEFVPLSFVHAEAPLHFRKLVLGVRPGPNRDDVVRLYAIARLILGPSFRNIQTSWVKEGLQTAQELLSCGANDLGGTLMNESISTAAGAQHGQFVSPSRLRRVIREAGRVPVQRDTYYRPLRTFTSQPELDPREPLDDVLDAEATFGSYRRLIAAGRSLSNR